MNPAVSSRVNISAQHELSALGSGHKLNSCVYLFQYLTGETTALAFSFSDLERWPLPKLAEARVQKLKQRQISLLPAYTVKFSLKYSLKRVRGGIT